MKKSNIIQLIFIVFILTCLIVQASPAAKEDPFIITGVAVDETGAPIPDSEFYSPFKHPPKYKSPEQEFRGGLLPDPYEDTSGRGPDKDGRFVIELPEGTYKIRLSPSPESGYLAVVLDEVEAVPGGSLDLGNVTFVRGAQIRGSLVNEDNKKVHASRFYKKSSYGFDGDIQIYPVSEQSVIKPIDSKGQFVATVPEGDWDLASIPCQESGLLAKLVPGIIAATNETIDLGEIVLNTGFTISGKVLDTQSLPLIDYRIIDLFPKTEAVIVGPSDKGEFAATLPDGFHELKIAPAIDSGLLAHVISVEGDTGDDYDLGYIQLTEGHQLSWSIVDGAGDPVSGEQFYTESDFGFYGAIQVHPMNHSTVIGPIDENGAFQVSLPEGEFGITLIPGTGSGLLAKTIYDIVVPMPSEASTFQPITLPQGAMVIGSIVDHEGSPFSSYEVVSLTREPGTIVYGPDLQGQFAATLPDGSHRLKFTPSPESGLLAYVLNIESNVGEANGNNAVQDLGEIALSPGRIFSWRIVDTDGNPIPGDRFYSPSDSGFYGAIQVYPMSESVVIGPISEDGMSSTTLPEGDFTIVLIPSLESGLLAYTITDTNSSGAIVAPLSDGFQIIGSVKDDQNQIFPFPELFALPAPSNAVIGNANGNGVFRATLPPGSHNLKLVPSAESGLLAGNFSVNGKAGEVQDLPDVRLQKGYQLSVKLTDDNGSPVSGGRFYQPSDYGFYGEIRAFPETPEAVYGAPDENGYCNITLPDGKFDILFAPPIESHLLAKKVQSVASRPGRSANLGDLEMRSAFAVKGSIASSPLKASQETLATSGMASEVRDGIWVQPNFERAEEKEFLTLAIAADVPPPSVDDVVVVPPTEEGDFGASLEPGSWSLSVVPAPSRGLLPKTISVSGGPMDTLDISDISLEEGVRITATLYAAKDTSSPERLLIDSEFYKPSPFDFDGEIHLEPSDTSAVIHGPDAQGQVVIIAPEGEYGLTFTPSPASGILSMTVTDIQLVMGNDVDLGNITLYEGQVITGSVVDDNGQPLTSFDVHQSPVYGDALGRDVVVAGNQNGQFSLTLSNVIFGPPRTIGLKLRIVPPAETHLLATVIDEFPQQEEPIDLGVISLNRAHTVVGRIVNTATGTPITGEMFYKYSPIRSRSDFPECVMGIFAHLHEDPQIADPIESRITCSGPDADGYFILNLPPVTDGVFTLGIVPSPASGFVPLPRQGVGSVLIGSEPAGVEENMGDVGLQPGILVSGEITDSSSNPYTDYEVIAIPLADPDNPISYLCGLWGANTFQVTLAGQSDVTIKSVTGEFEPRTFAGINSETDLGILEFILNPVVFITVPSDGDSFIEPAEVAIEVVASFPGSTADAVEFYQGDTLLGTDTTEPYGYTWMNVPTGNYQITAKALDSLGNSVTSVPVNVVVNTTLFLNPLVVEPVIDLRIQGNGIENLREFTRFYSHQSDHEATMGRGWSHKFNMFLEFPNEDMVSIKLFDADMRSYYFYRQLDGTYLPSIQDRYEKLTENQDGTYSIVKKRHKYVFTFSASGLLQRVTDLKGHETVLSYETQTFDGFEVNYLTNINTSDGHGFTLSYMEDWPYYLSRVSDTYGRTVYYNYNEDNLLSHVVDVRSMPTYYHYDEGGLLTSIERPDGSTTNITIDENYLITEISRSDGAFKKTLSYDLAQNTFTITDALNNPTVHRYTSGATGQQRIASVEHPDGGTEAIDYYENGLPKSKTGENGKKVWFEWADVGKIAKFTDQASNEHVFTYHPSYAKLTQYTDAKGRSADYTYNQNGSLETSLDRRRKLRRYEYDPAGNLWKFIDPLLNETEFRYDSQNFLTKKIDALTYETDFVWTEGYITTVFDELDEPWNYGYNEKGELTSETDPLDHTYSYVRDPNGDVTTITDPLEHGTVIEYFAPGKISKIMAPMTRITEFYHDDNGNLTGVKTPMELETIFGYNKRNRLSKTIYHDTSEINYEYLNNQLWIIRDQLGNEFKYQYNDSELISSIEFPPTKFRLYDYDENRNLFHYTDQLGKTITYDYYENEQLKKKIYQSGREITYEYYDNGWLRSATDTLSGLIDIQYDKVGRVKSVTNTQGIEIQYSYNPRGELIGLIVPGLFELSYEYYPNGFLKYIRDGQQNLIAFYEYDKADRTIGKTFGNGIQGTFGYDDADRLTDIVWKDGQGNVLESLNYEYNKDDQITKITRNGMTEDFAYDDRGQLISCVRSTGESWDYHYDAGLNRETFVHNSQVTSYTVQPPNQYASVGSAILSYDDRGHLMQMSDSGNTWNYIYDEDRNLIEVAHNGESISYEYDALGRRISRSDTQGNKVYYLWNFGEIIAELDESGNLLRYFVYGSNLDEHIMMSDGLDANYYLTDHKGSVLSLIGLVNEEYDYDPYGNVISVESTMGNEFYFTGALRDSETGFYHLRSRDYSSQFGRFLIPDAPRFYDGNNIYAYVENDPVNWTDPLGFGLKPWYGDNYQDLVDEATEIQDQKRHEENREKEGDKAERRERERRRNKRRTRRRRGRGNRYDDGDVDVDKDGPNEKQTDERNNEPDKSALAPESQLDELIEELEKIMEMIDPTFIQPARADIFGPNIYEMANSPDITAKIAIPEDGSIVRANVPVFGLAHGKDFERYSIEIAEGASPREEDFRLAEKSNIPQTENIGMDYIDDSTDESIQGNLATWPTGLAHYEYPPAVCKEDLHGLYTIRLRVFNSKGEYSEDRKVVEVGRVLSQVWPGKAESEDGAIRLEIPEWALTDRIELVAIRKDHLPEYNLLPEGYMPVSEVYLLRPAGMKFSKDVQLSCRIPEGLTDAETDKAMLLAYEPDRQRWTYLPAELSGDALSANIRGFFYPYTLIQMVVGDNDLAKNLVVADISSEKFDASVFYAALPENLLDPESPTQGHFVRKTFNSGYDEVQNLHGRDGAWLSLENESSEDGTPYLRLSNKFYGGTFASILCDQPFDIRDYPVLEFDYRMESSTKINMLFQISGRRYDLTMTDDPKEYKENNIRGIGRIKGFKSDGQWHHAEVDLWDLFAEYPDKRIIDQIVLADWDETGIMKLSFGKNRKGAYIDLDNFIIRAEQPEEYVTRYQLRQDKLNLKPTPSITEGVPDRFEWGLPQADYQSDLKILDSHPISIELPTDSPSERLLWSLGLTGNSKIASVVSVWCNGRQVEDLTISDGLNVYYFSTEEPMQEPLELRLSSPSSGEVALNGVIAKSGAEDFISIGTLDDSNREFSFEGNAKDDYIVGTAPELLERAVTRYDPETNINFFLTKAQAQRNFQLDIYVLTWDGKESKSEKSGVSFSIAVNGKLTEVIRTKMDHQKYFSVPIVQNLKAGHNMITLKYLGGSDWISWDCIGLRPIDNDRVVADGWKLGIEDNSSSEFSSAEEIEDRFTIGNDPQWFEGAIAESDPETHIAFSASASMKDQSAKLKLVACEIREQKEDFVECNVYLNKELKGSCKFRKNQKTAFVVMKGIKEGLNIITLKWSGGARWVTWDALSLEMLPKVAVSSIHSKLRAAAQ